MFKRLFRRKKSIINFRDTPDVYVDAVFFILIRADYDKSTVQWLQAVVDLPDRSRYIRLDLIYHCVAYMPESVFAAWLDRLAWVMWLDDATLDRALSALNPLQDFRQLNDPIKELRLSRAISTEVFESLTMPIDVPEAIHLRLDMLRRGRVLPSGTEWGEVVETIAHLGSAELVESLYGSEPIASSAMVRG